MTLRALLALGAFLALAAAPARASTKTVPGDFPTIQAALDAAQQNDVILISSGVYAESVTATSLPLNVTIKAKGNVRIDATGLGAALTVAGQNLQVIGVKVIGAGTDGIVVGGVNVVVSQCKVKGVTGRAFVVNGGNTTLEKCIAAESGGDGIALVGSSNTSLDKCRIIKAIGDGISIDIDSINAEASKCTILKDIANGIVNAGTNTDVHQCHVIKCLADGVHDDTQGNSSGGQYASNSILSGGASGFVLLSDNCVLDKNTVNKAAGTGIDVTGNGAVVTKNKIHSAGAQGLHVGGDTGTWTGNVSTHAGANGFVLDGAGNTLSFNKGHGSGGFDLLDNNVGANTVNANNQFGTTGP